VNPTTSELSEFPEQAVLAAKRFPWKLFFSVVVIAIFGSAGVVFGVVQWLRKDMVSPQSLTSIQQPVKTMVFDARGRVLHEFYKENRSPVPLKQIPRHLVNATIATEDRSFYQHWGVDLWGVARAAVTDVLHMRRAQGGSTITQQLARNVLGTHERTWSRKLRETVFAIEQQVKEAQIALRRDVAQTALRVAEEILRRTVDANDQRRFLENFMNEVGGSGADVPGAMGKAV